MLSFQVAALAVAIGCVTGSAAAVALHGRRFPGKGLVTGVIMAPIVVPLVVLALGGYLVFARLHMVGGWVAIGLLHGMLVTPYVFISVQTSLLAALNPVLVRSARSLGAGRLAVLRHVFGRRSGQACSAARSWASRSRSTRWSSRCSCKARKRSPCRCACSPPSSSS